MGKHEQKASVKKSNIILRVDKYLDDEFKKKCEEKDTTKSRVIRNFIKSFIAT